MLPNNRITVFIEDGLITMQMKKPIPFPDFVNLWFNGLFTTMQSVLSNAPPEHYQEIKEDMYEQVNLAAANVLTQFAPELERNPDFDPLEELQKQNAAIEAAYVKTKEV